MNKNKLREFIPDTVLIHPQKNLRCIFYSFLLAVSLKEKFKNLEIDIILPKDYSFLRNLLTFEAGYFKAKKDYDFYISFQKDYKNILKYKAIKSKIKFGIKKFMTYKFFDILLTDEDNPYFMIKELLKILDIDLVTDLKLKQLNLRPYIKRDETLFISPYSKKITNFLIKRITQKGYKLIYLENTDLQTLLTTTIHNYKRIIMLNSEIDHIMSFILKNKLEIIFCAINHKVHLYSRYTTINPVKYVCSPCNVNSVKCPLKYKHKQYLCLAKGIYHF